MNELEQLKIFSDNLLQDIIAASESEENGGFRINEFTRKTAEYLIDAGEIEEINVCYHKSRGMMINGYNVSQDGKRLDLVIAQFNQQNHFVSVTKSQVETAFRHAAGTLTKALAGHYKSMEESTEAYDMFLRIYELRDQLANVRIYLLTDGIVNAETIINENTGNISSSFHVWDIQRLFRFASSGKKMESIEIDFEKEFGITIPCLSMVDPNSDYQGYLAVIPGKVLADIYDKYDSRLLEHNVRSFLQVRGNVNKGIRKTIIEEPHRFFAYNNGISATADDIEIVNDSNGRASIRIVKNLQIVNGGQTTASLYHAAKKDKSTLENIYVQAKLSVIPSNQMDEIVPLISRYANSQNKVGDADFWANDPYHIQIEELSRTTWTNVIDGTNKQTQWFYERARGQYLDAKGREGTPARKRQFENRYPNAQKFTKTDLAKYENTWMQLPHHVSLGAQKNFTLYSLWLKEQEKTEITNKHFEHLVAKAILFKQAEKIIAKAIQGGGYRANIVTYTLALLSHLTSKDIDFESIWKKQNISVAMQEAIQVISKQVQGIITNPPDSKNITEWCKRKECWELIRDEAITLPQSFQHELQVFQNSKSNITTSEVKEDYICNTVQLTSTPKISKQTWINLSKWAKETNNLETEQRILVTSIINVPLKGSSLNPTQIEECIEILKQAEALGFNSEENKNLSSNTYDAEISNHHEELSNQVLSKTVEASAKTDNIPPMGSKHPDSNREDMLNAMKAILHQKGKMSRSVAIRATAKLLKENGVIKFERLRDDGPIWKGLKSAINSGLRRKIFEGNSQHIWVE